ncbi:hypothetical protein IJT93_11750 [bacterium]|nr:hypothetical protein [bacterium]
MPAVSVNSSPGAAYRELEKYSCFYRSHGCPENKRLTEFAGPISIYCQTDGFESREASSDLYLPKEQYRTETEAKPEAAPRVLPPAADEPGGNKKESVSSVAHGGAPQKKYLGALPLELAVENQDLQVWRYAASSSLEDRPPSLERSGRIDKADGCLQSFSAARATLDTFRRCGAELQGGEPLTLIVGHPQVGGSLPFYRSAAPKYIAVSQNEEFMHPDFISHEVGHAILDRSRQYDCSSLKTLAAHEAFADSCAFITSLQDREALWDILLQEALGNASSRASELGEFWGPQSRNAPVRDLASPAEGGEKSDPHLNGLRFSSKLYRLLQLCSQSCREKLTPRDCAGIEVPDEIFLHILQSGLPIHPFDYQCLSLAAQTVSRVFVNSLNFLPQTPELSLDDLQSAVKESARRFSLPGADLNALAEAAFS